MNFSSISIKRTLAVGVAAIALGGAAVPVLAQRTQHGSNVNIRHVRQRTERLIGQLQRDDRDYGGHRVAALNDLQAARSEMPAAEAYARAHGY